MSLVLVLLRDSLYRYVIAKKTASPVWWIAPALWDVGSICQGVVSVLISGDPVGFAIEQKVMKHAPSVLSASAMAAPSSKL